MRKTTGLLLCALCFLGRTPAQKKNNPIDTASQFDAYVQKAIKEWEVPGLAIVVVKNNNVVFKKAYGVRERGSGKMVNNQTMFVCASTTKP
jgi:CubicO group peptidase (beta-lactamase class C family)